MRPFIVLILGALLLAAFSPTGNGGTSAVTGNHFTLGNFTPTTPTPAPTPGGNPQALLTFGFYGGSCTVGTSTNVCGGDPGQGAMQAFYWGAMTQSTSGSTSLNLVNHCGGSRTATTATVDATGNHCTGFVYDGLFRYTCGVQQGLDPNYYWWQNAINNDENAIEHYAVGVHGPGGIGDGSGNISSTNRFVSGGESGQCSSNGSTSIPTPGPTPTTNDILENAGDSAAQACVYKYYATSNSPCANYGTGPWLQVGAGEGVGMDYMWTETSSGMCFNSTEFGTTLAYASPNPGGHGNIPCMTNFASFYNSMCPGVTPCIPMISKDVTGGAEGCMTTTAPAGVNTAIAPFNTTACYPTDYNFSDLQVNSRYYWDAFCAALTKGNFQAFLFEFPVQRTANTTPVMGVMQNTYYYNQTNNVCPGIKWAVEESSLDNFSEVMGFIWTLPNFTSGIPTDALAWRWGFGQFIPYFEDQEIVPDGPEQTLSPFSYGATIPASKIIDDGCGTTGTDVAPSWDATSSGGPKNITVWCPQQRLPVQVIQYHHCYSLGVDEGQCAAIINESNVNETVQSSWIGQNGGDPVGTYASVINMASCPAPTAKITVGPSSGFAGVAGDTVTVGINNHNVTYTLVSGDTTSATTLAAHLTAAINADSTDSSIITATSSGAVITIVSLTADMASQYVLSISQTGTGNETYTANDPYLFGVPCAGAWIPTGYSGSLLTQMQSINTACQASTSPNCLSSGQVATAVDYSGVPFAPSGSTGNCTNNAFTCVPAHSAIFLSSQASAPVNLYAYTGCSVNQQIFGIPGSVDPITGQDISSAGTDGNNGSLHTAWGTTTFGNQTDNSSLERVNCATNSTPTYVVQVNNDGSGHNPVVYANTGEGYANPISVPWCGGVGTGCTQAFYFEGNSLCQSGTPADCSSIDKHWIVLNTDAGWEIEGGGHGCNASCTNGPNQFTGTAFHAYAGMKLNLNDTYQGNWDPSGSSMGNSNGDSGISYLLTVLWSPDMADAIARSATVINHPLNLILPTSMSACFGTGCLTNSQRHTNISPISSGGDGSLSCNTLSGCYIYGDLLRLQSGVSCGSDQQSIIVCNTLKKYGMYLTDTGSSAPEIRMGIGSDGSDVFDAALITWIKGLKLNNFDLVTRGTTTPP